MFANKRYPQSNDYTLRVWHITRSLSGESQKQGLVTLLLFAVFPACYINVSLLLFSIDRRAMLHFVALFILYLYINIYGG